MLEDFFDICARMERTVSISDGRFVLSTSGFSGCNYAYYLRCKGNVEKKWYSSSLDVSFEMPIQPGAYQATFFYDYKKTRASFSIDFNLNCLSEIVISSKEIISDEDGYSIVYYDIGSPVTFIVFNTTGTTKKTKPFGLDFLLGRGFNVIACLQDNNQYQELSFARFKQLVSPLVDNKKVFLYGSSLGGYCAVYYAGAVNGTVIASAPRNSAHPVVVSASKQSKFKGFEYKHLDVSDNDLTSQPVCIFLIRILRMMFFLLRGLSGPRILICFCMNAPTLVIQFFFILAKHGSLVVLLMR